MSDDFKKLLGQRTKNDFKFVNHNQTDYDSFKDFQSSINSKFAKIEKEKSRRERIKNLKTWDENLVTRWKGASLGKIENTAAQQILEIIGKDGFESFYIHGDAGTGKTYISYGILRKFIGSGYVSPSQIKIISEETIMGYALTGFEGRARFDELFDSKYKVYLFDNVGSKEEYNKRREVPFWEQLMEHIYSNSLVAIFTSNEEPKSFAGILNESGESKFSHIIADRVIEVVGTRTPKLPEVAEKKSSGGDNLLDRFDS
jgi:DNA replication protein DnaC